MQKCCFVVLILLTSLIVSCSRSDQPDVKEVPKVNQQDFEVESEKSYKIDINIIVEYVLKNAKDKDYEAATLQYLNNVDFKDLEDGILLVYPDKAVAKVASEIRETIEEFCKEKNVEFYTEGPPINCLPPDYDTNQSED